MFFPATNRKMTAYLLGFCLATASLAGCNDTKEDRAAEAAKEALGVQDSKAQTKPREVIYQDVERVIDPATNKVLSEKETDTPVTIQVEVNKDVQADVGEAHAQAEAKQK